jgi:hypothetical protein
MNDYYQTLFNDQTLSNGVQCRFPNYRGLNKVIEHQSLPRNLRDEEPEIIDNTQLSQLNGQYLHPVRMQQQNGFNRITNGYLQTAATPVTRQQTIPQTQTATMVPSQFLNTEAARYHVQDVPAQSVQPLSFPVPVETHEGFVLCTGNHKISIYDIIIFIVFVLCFYMLFQTYRNSKKIDATIAELRAKEPPKL